MIWEVILGVMAVVFVLTMFTTLVMIAFEDTETFQAIDEKIARILRGEDGE